MYIIAGLGNPEKKYENTRHNIGFEAAMHLCDQFGIKLNKSKFKAIFGEGYIGGEKVIVALPQTYMNLSGDSLYELCTFYKVPAENVIILHDDISIECGRLRIRSKGSAGGHNGLKSIIARLGSDKFIRVKIGVGAPKHEDYDLADYVLGKFSSDEKKILESVTDSASKSVECMIKSGVEKAMNLYNS